MVVLVNYIGFHPTVYLDGIEKLRLSYPIEKIYILYDNKRDNYGAVSRRNAGKIREKLEFFKPIALGINPQSFNSVFENVYQILYKEAYMEKRTVFIDITDMPPESVSAINVLSLIFPKVYIYVVNVDKKGEFIPPPNTPSFEDWVEEKDNRRGNDIRILPLPVDRKNNSGLLNFFKDMDEERFSKIILAGLYKMKGYAESIKDIIVFCGEDPRDPIVKNKFSRIVRRLEEKGFLYKEIGGRNRIIKLTEFGKIYIEAILKTAQFIEREKRMNEIEKALIHAI